MGYSVTFPGGVIENCDRASLDVAINRIAIRGNGAAIHFVRLFRGHKILIDTKVKNTIRTLVLHAAGRKRVEDFDFSCCGIELEHLAGIKTVKPHHAVRSDISLRAAGMIVVIFRRSSPGLKLFSFDVKHRYGASLVTSGQPRIPLFIEFNRQVILSEAGLKRRYLPFLELTGARIEPADIGALKIVVPNHVVAVDCQIVGRTSLAGYFILRDNNFGVCSSRAAEKFSARRARLFCRHSN